MKVELLNQQLTEEGCDPINFSIGRSGSDVFCLENQNDTWRVFYTEPGKDNDPIFESMNEEEACEFYFEYISSNVCFTQACSMQHNGLKR